MVDDECKVHIDEAASCGRCYTRRCILHERGVELLKMLRIDAADSIGELDLLETKSH